MDASLRQQAHYERIHDIYEQHYYDAWSMRYRAQFIFPLLWKHLDLNDKTVAELACGSGHNSLAILENYPRVKLIGYDISPSACREYQRNVGFPAHHLDLTKPFEPSEPADVAFIIGGLHHCVADLNQTLRNVARILKPGGTFIMLEPNSQFFLEALRNLWYRLDKSFDAETEHALNHDEIFEYVGQYFRCQDLTYFGGPAYFGVLNSMILRVPLRLKPLISPPLMVAERLWNRLPGRSMHNVFLGRWVRNDTPVED